MTLHEAITLVLHQSKTPLTPKEIADVINQQQLYDRSDKNPVPESQISARINKYPELFIKNNDGTIGTRIDRVHNLLNLASQLQNKLRNIWAHGMVSPFVFQLLVPLFFFYKRTIDYPAILKSFNWLQPIIKYDSTGLISLAQQFNSNFDPLKSKLNLLINDLNKLCREDQFINIFNCLKDENLSDLDSKQFGTFFNELIYRISDQNERSGQYAIPKTLGELYVGLSRPYLKNSTRIYNPAAGYSTIPALISQNANIPIEYSGEEISTEVYILSLLNLMSNEINVDQFYNTDSLEKFDLRRSNDLVFCVPPFGGKYSREIENFPVTTNLIVLLFIQKCLLSINQRGTAIILVPESVLFNSGDAYVNLRKYLIDNGYLNAVISLPDGLFLPLSGIKTSLLVISHSNTKVKFIDGLLKRNVGKMVLDITSICDEYFDSRFENTLFEPSVDYGKQNSTLVEIGRIKALNYNITVNRHLLVEDKDQSRIKLNEVLSSYKPEKAFQKLRFVNISDLNSVYENIFLNIDKLETIRENQTGNTIQGPVLLIGSIPPNLKPTYYDKVESLIVSPNVYAFTVDTNKVKVEYLIYELNKDYIKEQIFAISVGVTSLRRYSAKDFLNIEILIPRIEEQNKVIKIHKEALVSKIFPESNVTITGKNEKEILGFVKHEIGNISGGIRSDIQNLEGFFNRNSIDLSKPISERKNAVSVSDILLRMNRNISDIGSILENIQNIIDFGNSKTIKEKLSFRKFIDNELAKYDHDFKSNGIKTFVGVSDIYDIHFDNDILIDSAQFALVIRNFIINSIKHGFTDYEQDKILVFKLKQDSDYYYVSLINTGIPFPENFTIDDFLGFGIRHETSKGSGLGGYLMGKVIENHEGKIEVVKQGNEFSVSLSNSIIWVNPTVHFLITLPKS